MTNSIHTFLIISARTITLLGSLFALALGLMYLGVSDIAGAPFLMIILVLGFIYFAKNFDKIPFFKFRG